MLNPAELAVCIFIGAFPVALFVGASIVGLYKEITRK